MRHRNMSVVLVGSGNREKAIRSKIYSGSRVRACHIIPWTNTGDVLAFLKEHKADLVINGPEAPIVGGLADTLNALGFPTVGPTAAAARIEGSKLFGREICEEAGVRTPEYWRIDSERDAEALLANWEGPIVVKLDDLQDGKGVIIASSVEDTLAAVSEALPNGPVSIERFLVGEEISVFFACDGIGARFIGDAGDKKRLLENDEGPNTGSMGGWSPSTYLTVELLHTIRTKIVEPVLKIMRKRGCPYHGILYLGLMLVKVGDTIVPYLIEFNCRWGDPEAQVILPRLKNDLIDILIGTMTEGGLASLPPIEFHREKTVGITIADHEYPKKGKRIQTVVGSGTTFAKARANGYGQIKQMLYDGTLSKDKIRYRTDIAADIL